MQKLLKVVGRVWKVLSKDLTQTGKNVSFCSLQISKIFYQKSFTWESSIQFRILKSKAMLNNFDCTIKLLIGSFKCLFLIWLLIYTENRTNRQCSTKDWYRNDRQCIILEFSTNVGPKDRDATHFGLSRRYNFKKFRGEMSCDVNCSLLYIIIIIIG